MSRTGTATPVVASERYADTLRRLASAQKVAAPGAPAYSIYVNRKVGRYIAAAAFRAGLTPNAVTMISAVFTFTGITAIAVAPPLWWVGILVWLLLAVGYAFDSADGQVARLRGGGSPSGEWLDHVVDAIKISTLHLAVLITFFTHFSLPSPVWLLVPLGFTAVASVAFFAMILNDLLKAKHGSHRATVPRRSTPLRAIAGIPTDYGVLCLAFVLLGFPWLFVGVYTVLFAFNAAYLVLALVKWFTDMVALGRAEA
ncbi:CDP-alcohol phosphatidyltransferase family protein [Glaciibacter sp. 2TAF33]|uniref:CDP-alcohol phosphatidyltransferase family protein n=1 Tax=Glaciibacter sp. 2TAF33 TaxID=3233015 RepID=UPI003F9284A2